MFLRGFPQIPSSVTKNTIISANTVGDKLTINKDESKSFHFSEEHNRAVINNDEEKMFQFSLDVEKDRVYIFSLSIFIANEFHFAINCLNLNRVTINRVF